MFDLREQTNSPQIKGQDGRESRLCVWSNPGDDVTGVMARCEKMAGTCETVSCSVILDDSDEGVYKYYLLHQQGRKM